MADIPQSAITAAATAIDRELMSGTRYGMAADSDEALARAALEAAAPFLAEAWNLPSLQAEHEEWQRRGETARRLRDEFFRDIDARYPSTPEARPENDSVPAGTEGED